MSEREDTLPLDVYRVLHGVLLFLTAAFLFPDREVWFSNHGLVPKPGYAPFTSLFAWIANPDPWITPLLIILMVASIALAAGFFARSSALIAFIVLMALQHRTPQILNGADVLLRVNTLYLLFPPRIATLFIRVQLSIVYLGTFYWKVHGQPWVDGTALYYILSLAQFQRYPGNGLFIPLAVSKIATWGTLVVEFAAGSLIWLRRFRYYVLGAALALHLGIEMLMNVPLFEWTMIASLVTFIEAADLRRGLQRVRVRRPAESPGTG